jgi:lactose/L-arabinose transport system substrate-binding protein
VEIQVENMGNDQLYDKLTTCLASGVGLLDVVSVEGERVANFVTKFPKGFVDLTNEGRM